MALRIVLTPERLARLETALYGEDAVAQSAAVTELTAPEELHAFVSHYNRDTGVRDIRRVIESPACDKGTALMVYWLTDGVFSRERDGARLRRAL